MINPYSKLRENWLKAPRVEGILESIVKGVTFSGENEIHARGFFSELTGLVKAFGDTEFWLLDLDGDGERHLRFDVDEMEPEYYAKLQEAPEWAPQRPFPYAVRYQAFVGSGKWLLLSDRDGERMYLFIAEGSTTEQLRLAAAMFRTSQS